MPKQIKVLRISHTIASLWDRGATDTAILALTGRYNPPPTIAMDLGLKIHKEFEDETNETGKLPAEFGLDLDGMAEIKFVKTVYNEGGFKIEVSGVVDFCDGPDKPSLIVDHKTGQGTAGDYIMAWQLPLYAYFFGGQTGMITHKNTRDGRLTIAVRHLDDHLKRTAAEWLLTTAMDLRATCESAGVRWWRRIEDEKGRDRTPSPQALEQMRQELEN